MPWPREQQGRGLSASPFAQGERLWLALQNYFLALRWIPDDPHIPAPDRRLGCAWLELAVDFMHATGLRLPTTLTLAKHDAKKPGTASTVKDVADSMRNCTLAFISARKETVKNTAVFPGKSQAC